MRIVFDVRNPVDWTTPFRQTVWGLLPLGARPMVATWIEQACAQGHRHVEILANQADLAVLQTELGGGERWGCQIDYRTEGAADADLLIEAPCLLTEALTCVGIASLADYLEINLDIAAGTHPLPVAPGYSGSAPGESVGLAPILAPSARFTPPLLLGDHVRVNPFVELGPSTVLGNHVVVGRGSRVIGSLVLDDTYIGSGLNVVGRILDGCRLIDPVDGTTIELDDLLLADLNHTRSPLRRGLTRLRDRLSRIFSFRSAAASDRTRPRARQIP